MKILMLTPYVPYPPSSGGQIRTYNLLKHLYKNNEITLLCLYKNSSEKKYLQKLKKYCHAIYFCRRARYPWQLKNILRSVFSRKPFLIVRNYSVEAEITLKEILRKKKFDVIHAETFYIMPHLPKTDIPIFLVEQTIEYKVYQHFINSLPLIIRPFFYPDILKLKFWERSYWKDATLVGTVSETDKKSVTELEPNIDPVVIPNGAGDEMLAKRLPKKDFFNVTVLFVGNFFWLQNVEAANFLIQKIYPRLKERLPSIKILIAGQSATKKIKINNSDSLKIIDIMPFQDNVIKKIYRDSTLFIAPIFGPGGTRLKILAAMASGLPVISTKIGIEGLAVRDGYNTIIANNPEEFIEKITLVLKNKKLFEEIRRNAYLLVQDIYNWQTISIQLESVYKKIALPKI